MSTGKKNQNEAEKKLPRMERHGGFHNEKENYEYVFNRSISGRYAGRMRK